MPSPFPCLWVNDIYCNGVLVGLVICVVMVYDLHADLKHSLNLKDG